MRWQVHRVADLPESEQAAVRTLGLAVYPPDVAAAWPGRAFEWAPHQWAVVGRDAEDAALCYVGLVLRDARWGDRAVRVGGIGGVKTHPASRGRGFATTAIQRALDYFHGQGDVDFALLVCEAGLVPFYERLGWRRFLGELFVAQRQATVPFTFNLPMTTPVRLREPLAGAIDLLSTLR